MVTEMRELDAQRGNDQISKYTKSNRSKISYYWRKKSQIQEERKQNEPYGIGVELKVWA